MGAKMVSTPVWKPWRRDKSLAYSGNRNSTIILLSSPQHSHFPDFFFPALTEGKENVLTYKNLGKALAAVPTRCREI